MTILTLLTHMLLSIPVFHTPPLSLNIVRYTTTHHQTMLIILATFALKQYHPIWFTPSSSLLPTSPIDRVVPYSDSSSLARVPPLPPQSQSSPSTQHAVTNSQILVPPLIHDGTPTQNNTAILNRERPTCFRDRQNDERHSRLT